jgi:hypothetical protein
MTNQGDAQKSPVVSFVAIPANGPLAGEPFRLVVDGRGLPPSVRLDGWLEVPIGQPVRPGFHLMTDSSGDFHHTIEIGAAPPRGTFTCSLRLEIPGGRQVQRALTLQSR